MAGSIQEVNKAIANMNKGSDKKEEMRMKLAAYSNWDRFLTPAPLSIALLGQLILVSADADFSLEDKSKGIKFEKLKYPDSFRACLVQVSNSGWNAFNKAHTNMDQIRLYSGNVESHVRTAVKFLLNGTHQEVELMLPDCLKSIDTIADQCVILSSSVEQEFVYVMEMVAELLEACTRAKGQYEQDLKETNVAIQVAKEHKEAVEAQKEEAQKKRDAMQKQMKNAEDDFREAINSNPSTLDLIGLAVAGAVIDVAKNVANVFDFSGKKEKSSSASPANQASAPPSGAQGESEEMKILKHIPSIRSQVDSLVKMATSKKSSDGHMEPDWKIIQSGNGVLYIKEQLNTILKRQLPKSEIELRRDVEELCNDGIEICQIMQDLAKAMSRDSQLVADVISRVHELSKRVETLMTALNYARGGNTLPSPPPQMKASSEGGNGGLVKSAMENARFKTETAKEMLKDSRKSYDKSCEELAEKMKEYGNILADLAKHDLKKIDFEKIREILIRGIKALGELREQWGKLVQFFQMLSNLVKCSLESSLKTFTSQTSKAGKLTEAGVVISNTMRDVIFEQAFQANQIAYVVNSISGAYFEISRDHLMERVTCLGKLVALDPEKDKHEIQMKRDELNKGCFEAQEAIKRIASRKQKEIDEAFDKRIGRIEQEVEALIPPLPETKIKEIQSQAKSAIAIGKAAANEEEIDDLI